LRDFKKKSVVCVFYIVQDYNQEFKKTSSNIASIVEREDLLSSVQSDISSYREGTKRNQKIDTLQRELEHTRWILDTVASTI
jgi:predicted  nucleic acid-binding Zn-ribbon protein